LKEKSACNQRGRLKSRLHGCQPAEKSPGQPPVIDQDDPLSSGNHERYIANRSAFDNETADRTKGAACGPLCIS